jgi:hypothetical protein
LTGYTGSGGYGTFIYRTFNGSAYQEHFSITPTGNIGLGSFSPFLGTTNKGIHISKGHHTSILFGDPVNQNYGGIVQTSDAKHRVFIGANLYDDETSGWKNFVSNKGGVGISLLADKNNWGTEIAFYLSDSDNTLTQRMTLKANGNIGIGTINPTEKLVVAGKILAMEVKVQNVPASDYVFEPDYNLLSLHEVESFIKENKHLPDIPSAAEFKENGVGLGEMDNMLLRKVEELMLYVIDLKKENESQTEEIKNLKLRLNEKL